MTPADSFRAAFGVGRGWWIVCLLLIGLALTGCASAAPDDGHAFLLPTQTPQLPSGSNHVWALPLLATPMVPTRGPIATPRRRPSVTVVLATTVVSSATPISTRPPPTRMPTPSTPVVFLDPGHGGIDSGTIGTTSDGTEANEKTIALAIAQRAADHLRRDGLTVVLSRTDDTLPGAVASDYTPDGTELTPDGVLADLQRRIDLANASGASVIFSIHLNSFSDPSVGGTQTFYDSSRPFGDESQRFASLIQSTLVSALQAAGFTTPDRGVTGDQELQTESLGAVDPAYNHLILLGPEIVGRLRPSEMPGALTEVMFLSDPTEVEAVIDPVTQEIIATAYATAIEQFLRSQPH